MIWAARPSIGRRPLGAAAPHARRLGAWKRRATIARACCTTFSGTSLRTLPTPSRSVREKALSQAHDANPLSGRDLRAPRRQTDVAKEYPVAITANPVGQVESDRRERDLPPGCVLGVGGSAARQEPFVIRFSRALFSAGRSGRFPTVRTLERGPPASSRCVSQLNTPPTTTPPSVPRRHHITVLSPMR